MYAGVMDSWRLDGIAGPHDLAVAPAPLAATGAGDRTWALFIAEAAKDADNHVHKLLVLHPSASPSYVLMPCLARRSDPASLTCAQDTVDRAIRVRRMLVWCS